MQAIFFANPSELRHWLEQNREQELELWVGIYKKETGMQTMTWAEAVDEALCFGWAESRVKKIDKRSYAVRLSPRKAGSKWSMNNVKKAESLLEMGLMESSGKEAFLKRDKSKDYDISKTEKLELEYVKEFKNHPKAWAYFEKSSPAYRKNASGWVMRAKRKETQVRRLKILIESSEKGQRIPLLR